MRLSKSSNCSVSKALSASLLSAELIFYPNPVKDVLFISGNPKKSQENPMLTIRNVSGKIMFGGVLKQQIDLSFLPSGLYVLELSDGFESKFQKFIKE